MSVKKLIEFDVFVRSRRLLHEAQRRAADAAARPRVPQAKPLTPNQLDWLRNRRLDEDARRRAAAADVFGRKKKLPLPVFACENIDCEEPSSAQVRPRIARALNEE